MVVSRGSVQLDFQRWIRHDHRTIEMKSRVHAEVFDSRIYRERQYIAAWDSQLLDDDPPLARVFENLI